MKIIIVIIGTAIIFFIFGFGLSYAINKPDLNNTYQSGWDAATKRFSGSDFHQEALEKGVEITSLTGTIINISGSILDVKIRLIDPYADPELDIRKIDVSNAEIVKTVKKSEEQYQEEVKQKLNGQHVEGAEYYEELPSEYIEEQINVDKLIKGQNIVVRASENIRSLKEFSAKKIVVE